MAGIGDILETKGGLEKLRITAFDADDYKNVKKSFIVMYNPTSYSYTVSTLWLTERSTNPDGKTQSFRSNLSDKITFDFMFDATGASPPAEDKPGSAKSEHKDLLKSAETVSALTLITNSGEVGNRHVDDAIKEFFNITYKRQDDTHLPNYLQLNWGAFEFRGVLESATVNYKLFNAAGLPIRATITANFAENLSKTEQKQAIQQSSPDLSHVRTMEEGDNLPLMANRIYGNSSYYLELARINNLTNFRNIRMGQKIFFPPLNKKGNAGK